MSFVIKDLNSAEYFLRKPGESGWYGHSISKARVYQTTESAKRVISKGGHHVSYPGNRDLCIVPVSISDP